MAGEPHACSEEVQAACAARSRLASRKFKKSAAVLAVNTVAAAMFLKGMPLHFLFQPLGQILLILWVLVVAATGFDVIAVIGIGLFDES
jgi:hypothetical protein